MPARTSFTAAVAVLSGALLLGLTGCKKEDSGGAAAAVDEIVIGEVAAMTGNTATFGQSSHAGTQMAVDEVNEAGGLLGKKLKLISEDDQSKQGEAGTLAKKLISRSKIIALLGEVASGRSLEMGPICQKAGVPMISPASTNPKVTEVGDYVFRVCFTDPFQGRVLGKFALARGWKKVAILTDAKQDYSVGLTQYFKEYFLQHGGTVVSAQSYGSNDKDFKAQLTAIKPAAPDAVLASGYYNEAALIASQARELGISVPFFGGDGWDSDSLVKVGGKAVEGCFFSDHFSDADPAAHIQAFVSKYKERFHKEPDAMAALGYDSAMILCDAIKRAGTTKGDALRDAIAATKAYKAITGVITINAQRNADKPAMILEVKNGKFAFAEAVTE